jgi:hypothetical protein
MPYDNAELHRLARYHWNSQPKGHTLQPTTLIHEAYMKLAGQGEKAFSRKNQFFALASMAMRQILMNHAEANMAQKRGGGQDNVSLSDVDLAVRISTITVTRDWHAARTWLAREIGYGGGPA